MGKKKANRKAEAAQKNAAPKNADSKDSEANSKDSKISEQKSSEQPSLGLKPGFLPPMPDKEKSDFNLPNIDDLLANDDRLKFRGRNRGDDEFYQSMEILQQEARRTEAIQKALFDRDVKDHKLRELMLASQAAEFNDGFSRGLDRTNPLFTQNLLKNLDNPELRGGFEWAAANDKRSAAERKRTSDIWRREIDDIDLLGGEDEIIKDMEDSIKDVNLDDRNWSLNRRSKTKRKSGRRPFSAESSSSFQLPSDKETEEDLRESGLDSNEPVSPHMQWLRGNSHVRENDADFAAESSYRDEGDEMQNSSRIRSYAVSPKTDSDDEDEFEDAPDYVPLSSEPLESLYPRGRQRQSQSEDEADFQDPEEDARFLGDARFLEAVQNDFTLEEFEKLTLEQRYEWATKYAHLGSKLEEAGYYTSSDEIEYLNRVHGNQPVSSSQSRTEDESSSEKNPKAKKEVKEEREATPEQKAEASKLRQEGNKYMVMMEHKLGLGSYIRANALDPKNPVIMCNLAAAYNSLEMFAMAKNWTDEVLKIAPHTKHIFYQRYLATNGLKQNLEAIEVVKAWLFTRTLYQSRDKRHWLMNYIEAEEKTHEDERLGVREVFKMDFSAFSPDECRMFSENLKRGSHDMLTGIKMLQQNRKPMSEAERLELWKKKYRSSEIMRKQFAEIRKSTAKKLKEKKNKKAG